MAKRNDSPIINYRLAVSPISKKNNPRELNSDELAFVREVRMIHNALGTWANAMLLRGATIPEVKQTINQIAKEVSKL